LRDKVKEGERGKGDQKNPSKEMNNDGRLICFAIFFYFFSGKVKYF